MAVVSAIHRDGRPEVEQPLVAVQRKLTFKV